MGDGEVSENKEDTQVTFSSVVSLNVGGKLFATRLSTLRRYPESMLAVMFSGRHKLDTDSDGNYFIDRDGTHFNHILNFLRHDDIPPAEIAEDVIKEAMYYGIDPLIEYLKNSPALFSEYIVRKNIRDKIDNYFDIKEDIISLAKTQAVQNGTLQSKVRLVITKNQPIPRDLQFSKQVYKQYYRRFKTYKTFEECLGRYFIQVPSEKLKCTGDSAMDQIAQCILHDLRREGYKGNCRAESIHEDGRIKTVTWCDEEFHICSSIHLFTFHWLEIDKNSGPHNRHNSANF